MMFCQLDFANIFVYKLKIKLLSLYSFTIDLIVVRLNLFNHVLALFHAKFSCNLAIRYPVFRWDLCKGSV